MGGDATKEPPFFFTKPADAVVPVVPPAVGQHRAIRWRRRTSTTRSSSSSRSARPACNVAAESANDAGLRLCGRPRHDAPRPAERHAREEAAVGHRQVVRAGGADRADPSASPRRASCRAARSRSTSTARAGRQGDLADMIWDVPHTLAFLSQYYELLPGDLIFTGTPAGVGAVVAGDRLDGAHRRPDAAVDRDRAGTLADVRWPHDAGGRRARLQQPRGGAGSSALASRATPRCRRRARSPRWRRGATCATARIRKETLDLFVPPAAPRGTFVFIHGGYWRALDKDDYSFVARAVRRAGHRGRGRQLRPVSRRVASRRSSTSAGARSRGWCAKAPRTAPPAPLVVGGHSAGGHLAAMMFATDWRALGLRASPFAGGVSLSGVHDLAPLVRRSMQRGPASSTPPRRARCRRSPARARAPRAARRSPCGADETTEFVRQSQSAVGRLADDAGPPASTARCSSRAAITSASSLDYADAEQRPHAARTLALF